MVKCFTILFAHGIVCTSLTVSISMKLFVANYVSQFFFISSNYFDLVVFNISVNFQFNFGYEKIELGWIFLKILRTHSINRPLVGYGAAGKARHLFVSKLMHFISLLKI